MLRSDKKLRAAVVVRGDRFVRSIRIMRRCGLESVGFQAVCFGVGSDVQASWWND